jgi:hypothetical protein
MWRELGQTLKIGLGLTWSAGDSNWPDTWFGRRGTVYDWTGIEGGFAQSGLAWGMEAAAVLDSGLGECPRGPEGPALIDVAAYGLPWLVQLEFTDGFLGAVSMAYYRGLSRTRPFKGRKDFDSKALKLSVEDVFVELASHLSNTYGPPGCIDAHSDQERWEWQGCGTTVAAERGPSESFADIYLTFRPCQGGQAP